MKSLLIRISVALNPRYRLIGIVPSTVKVKGTVPVLKADYVKKVFGMPTRYISEEAFGKGLKPEETINLNLVKAQKTDLVYINNKSGDYTTV